MRRPVYNVLVAGIWAVAGLATAAADRTQAFSPERQNCDRPFPSFVWAGALAGEQEKVGYQYDPRDVDEVATTLVDAAIAAKSVEAVVVVLSKGDTFSTAGVSDANAIFRASSGGDASLHCRSAMSTFPHTYPGASSMSQVLPRLAAEAGVSVKEVPLGDVMSVLSDDAILMNGKLDFVVAYAPEDASIQETDAFVRGLTTKLDEESEGRFLLLWTGDFHGEDCGRRALSTAASNRRRLSEGTGYRYILITPDILSGVLVMVLFVFILTVGYGCVGDIECPQHFPKVNPAKGKEY